MVQQDTISKTAQSRVPIADAFSSIAHLAGNVCDGQEYYEQLVKCIAAALKSPYASIEVMLSSRIISESCHLGSGDPGFWKDAVDKLTGLAIASKKPMLKLYSSKDGRGQIALLSAVLSSESLGFGAITVVMDCNSHAEARQYHAILQSLADLASACGQYIGESRAIKKVSDDQTSWGKVLSQASTYSSRRELAFSIVNNLRNRAGCDQVSLGIVASSRVRVEAISGLDGVKKNSPNVQHIQAAMEECLDLGKVIICQKIGPWSQQKISTGCRLHSQWHNALDGLPVASVPLFAGEKCVAVVSLRRNLDEQFSPDGLDELAVMLKPYATAITLVERATLPLTRHTGQCLVKGLCALVKPGGAVRLACAIAAVVLVGVFMFGKMDHTITVPCSITPAGVRHVSVPHAGKLCSVGAIAGDHVIAGQVLCEFDTEMLHLEVERIKADLAIAQIEKAQAMVNRDQTARLISEGRCRQIMATLKITNRKIELATIRAPFDGVVTQGDLRHRIGEVLAQGVSLFEVSPQSKWVIEMQIPENDVKHVKMGLEGDFRSNASPDDSAAFRMMRVFPGAMQQGQKNIFLGQAALESDGIYIRPGMEGVAKIDAGRRQIWWVLSHRIIDSIQMRLSQ